MFELLKEFAAIRRHLSEEFLKEFDGFDDKFKQGRYGFIRTDRGVFSFSVHGVGANFYNIFQRVSVDIESIEKYERFSWLNFFEYLSSRGVLLSEEATKMVLADCVQAGLITQTSDLTFSHS